MTVEPRLLEKLQALLAKEGAAGTTPEEVAAALGAAARLMERHGLTMADLQSPDSVEIDPVPLFTEDPKVVEAWLGILAASLAQACGCTCLIDPAGSRVHLVGRKADVQAARYLFDYCRREGDRLARERKKRKQGPLTHWLRGGNTTATIYFDDVEFFVNQDPVEADRSFRLGAIAGIRHAIELERVAERERFKSEQGSRALVVIEAHEARRGEAQQFADDLGAKRTEPDTTVRDPLAARAGAEAGVGIYADRARPGAAALGESQRRLKG